MILRISGRRNFHFQNIMVSMRFCIRVLRFSASAVLWEALWVNDWTSTLTEGEMLMLDVGNNARENCRLI